MKAKIKVFVPMSDIELGADNNLYRQLVPFDSSYLVAGQPAHEGCKPRNWVSESDRKQARERLLSTVV